ncbi:hypothetical protein C8T65DRAFT_185592 [Cerioporus squamosus]|nr:hypothetical protein C8T65DRAFT_185592 [Cerioporus squamosus]
MRLARMRWRQNSLRSYLVAQVLETNCRMQAIVELRSGTASAMLCLASHDSDKTGCAHPLRHSDCRPSVHSSTNATMSSTAVPDAAAIASEFYHISVDAYFSISTCAFFIYEYFITFDREVELFWKGKMTGASIIFLLNRYLPLLTQLLYLTEYTTSTMSAKLRAVYQSRCCHCSRSILPLGLFLCTASLRPFEEQTGINLRPPALLGYSLNQLRKIWVWSKRRHLRHSVARGLRAHGQLDDSNGASVFIIISRTCLITADLILVAITWITLPRRTVDLSFTGRTFAGVLLRDGIAYFLVLLTMNVLHMAFSLRSILTNADISEITVFTEPVTAVLVSRFLIDLQEANRKAVHQTSFANPDSSLTDDDPLHFANFVNSFGASIAVPGVEEENRFDLVEAEKPTQEDTGSSSDRVNGSET